MINYIKENYKIKTDKEIAEKFNVKTRKISTVRQKLRLLKRETPHTYTEKELEFLKTHRKSMDKNQLRTAFNKEFNTSLTAEGLAKVCRERKWYCELSLSELNSKELTLGRTTKQGRGRIAELVIRNGEKVFIDRKRLVYEQANNCKLKQSQLIIFLDGNINNFEPSNLYCVDRKTNLMMCRNKWYTNSREHNLTAIKWCELFYALKGGDYGS